MLKKFKPWEDLTFTDDYMFKLLMERKRICKGTLNAFLNWNIRSITYFATEKPLQAGYAAKGVRLDVYLHDEVSRIYDVEMQVLKKKEKPHVDAMMALAKRARFYLGELDTRALERSGLSARACTLLDYMNGKITKEPLIAQIEESMCTIKQREIERKSYMTYLQHENARRARRGGRRSIRQRKK